MSSIKLMSFEEELKKNPELKETDVQMLREWCKKQSHLPKISDSELALFLHSNYYRLEPAKITIENFFTVRSHIPEFFCNRDPINDKGLKKAFQTMITHILKETTREGQKIIYVRLLDGNPANYVYNDLMKMFNMVIDLWLYAEGICDGHVILVDMTNTSFGHIGRLSPMGLKKFFYYLQEAMPVRLKGFHFINTLPVLDVILNMIRPFMKKQLIDVLHIHTTNDTLEKFIPLEILPNESGGQAGSIQELQNEEIKKLEANIAWFQDDEANHRVNESLRLGKIKTATDLFGVEGNFKKLEID